MGALSGDEVAAELASALGEHEAAAEVWQQLTDDQRDTYLHWIASAKAATRRSARVNEVVKLLPSLPAVTRYGLGLGGVIDGFPAMP